LPGPGGSGGGKEKWLDKRRFAGFPETLDLRLRERLRILQSDIQFLQNGKCENVIESRMELFKTNKTFSKAHHISKLCICRSTLPQAENV
jgi:hypothetical protein